MFGDKFSLTDLLKNAGKMQEMMEKAQAELAKIVVIGEAGAGAVKIKMNCRYAVLEVSIDDEALTEKTVLQDLIAAAINDATRKVEEASKNSLMNPSSIFKDSSGE